MIDERKEEIAALYALDLLEGPERSAFEQELARDGELRQLVSQLREASAQLAHTASAEPSPALRARVLASIASTPAAGKLASVAPPTQKTDRTNGRPLAPVVAFPALGRIGWAAAACFALATGYLTTRYLGVRTEVISLRSDLEMTRVEAQSIRQQLEANQILSVRQIADLRAQQTAAADQIAALHREGDLAQLKIAKLASLVNTPEAAAIAVWNPLKQEGVLSVEKLAALSADQDYQLWVFDPKKADPVSCEVFRVDDKGTAQYHFKPDEKISAAAVFAVTRERKGGVPKPQGPIVLRGDL